MSVFSRMRPGPLFYIYALVLIYLAAFVAHMRLNGIFSCPATLYSGDRYLGHCDSTAYGDYDHGAFWFDLEPEIRPLAQSADVMFVGNSRMQFGLSAPALGRWFAEEDRNYYLLGFSHDENVNFISPMLRALQPRARAYVVDADGFFVTNWSGPGRDVVQGDGTEKRYRAKRAWQVVHRVACARMPSLCGETMAYFRQRETGEFSLGGTNIYEPEPVDQVVALDIERVAAMRGSAVDFVAELAVTRECVIFTYVPPRQSDRATIRALAEAVGVAFVSPELAGLNTFDGSHLDRESAQRFTVAFLDEAEALLRPCLTGTAAERG